MTWAQAARAELFESRGHRGEEQWPGRQARVWGAAGDRRGQCWGRGQRERGGMAGACGSHVAPRGAVHLPGATTVSPELTRQQGRPASWRHRPPIHGSLNAPRWRREASRGPQRQFQTVLVVPWFTQLSAVLALLFKRQKMRQRRRSAIFQCQPRGILCPYFISSPFLRLHTTLLTRLPTHHSPCSLPVPIPSPFTNHHLSPSSFPIFFPKICHLAPPRTY